MGGGASQVRIFPDGKNLLVTAYQTSEVYKSEYSLLKAKKTIIPNSAGPNGLALKEDGLKEDELPNPGEGMPF